MTNVKGSSSFIVIVGSKPNPILPDRIDTIVFCNGSIYLMDRPDLKPRQIFHCMTNSVLQEDKSGADLVRPRLRGKQVDCLIEIQTIAEAKYNYSWADLGYSFKERRAISNQEKGDLSFSVLDTRFYWDLVWAPCPAREKVSVFWNAFWRRKKPAASTGILALLSAIQALNSGNETFVVSGIGLVNDGYHFFRSALPRGHLCMDYCVLRALARSPDQHRILVTDQQLSRTVKLPVFVPTDMQLT